MIRKSSSFAFANSNYKNKTLRKGVKTILNDDFSTTKDGMKRALFIICNELKQIYPKNEALELVKNWNIRMGTPFKYGDISFRINSENKYFLKTSYINEFLEEIGILKSE